MLSGVRMKGFYRRPLETEWPGASSETRCQLTDCRLAYDLLQTVAACLKHTANSNTMVSLDAKLLGTPFRDPRLRPKIVGRYFRALHLKFVGIYREPR